MKYWKSVLGVVAVFCLVGLAIRAATGITYSEGHRDGYVQKMSHKGFPKTWEGEMVLGNAVVVGRDPGNATLFRFSVCKKDVVDVLNDVNVGQLVRLHYRQMLYTLPWEGRTDYFVEKVEELGHGRPRLLLPPADTAGAP